MWQQMQSYRQQEGAAALQNFSLNILGEVLGDFAVPGEQSCCVAGLLILFMTVRAALHATCYALNVWQ